MLGDLSLKSLECSGLCVAGKQQMHDGHVVRLTGTEGAVDECAFDDPLDSVASTRVRPFSNDSAIDSVTT